MDVLYIDKLSIGLNETDLLVKNLSLRIEQGKIHGLIGESGSGKSLTAISIMGLLPKSLKILSGSINLHSELKSKNLAELAEKEMRLIRGKEIGFIFQDPMTALNPVMRCGHQVQEAILLHEGISHREAEKRVLELFKKVKLPDPEKAFSSYPHEISGGQRQRVMIAQAISCSPKLLIADEPTTALDVEVQMAIVDLINELRKSDSLSVLFISHDLGLISEIADNISIMYKGEIVESGQAIGILESPQNPYTKGLLACKPPIDKKIERLPTIDDYMSEAKAGKIMEESLGESFISDEILLNVSDLSAYYPLSHGLFGQVKNEFQVLKDIEFSVMKGESLGLVGESGSGKSSLGRAILHLLETRQGEVKYQGELISHMPEKVFRKWRTKIQFIFQDPYSSLNPKIQIGEAISEVLNVHNILPSKKERKTRAEVLLNQVGLSSSDYEKYPHQFSGGQRQRVVIARALAVEPEFIICDEAVSALDVSVQAQILNLLKKLKVDFGLTYLFITHDMSVVRFFCDRVLVMKNGKLLEKGKTDEIFENPKHEYTRSLIDFAKRLS